MTNKDQVYAYVLEYMREFAEDICNSVLEQKASVELLLQDYDIKIEYIEGGMRFVCETDSKYCSEVIPLSLFAYSSETVASKGKQFYDSCRKNLN